MGIPTYNNPVDCSDVPEMGGEKKLTYVINGHDYDIDPIDYMVGPVTRDEAYHVQPYLSQLSSSSSLRSLTQK